MRKLNMAGAAAGGCGDISAISAISTSVRKGSKVSIQEKYPKFVWCSPPSGCTHHWSKSTKKTREDRPGQAVSKTYRFVKSLYDDAIDAHQSVLGSQWLLPFSPVVNIRELKGKVYRAPWEPDLEVNPDLNLYTIEDLNELEFSAYLAVYKIGGNPELQGLNIGIAGSGLNRKFKSFDLDWSLMYQSGEGGLENYRRFSIREINEPGFYHAPYGWETLRAWVGNRPHNAPGRAWIKMGSKETDGLQYVVPFEVKKQVGFSLVWASLSLMRRELEKPNAAAVFRVSRKIAPYLNLLKNSQEARRQQWMQFAFHVCLGEQSFDWMQNIKEAFTDPSVSPELADCFVRGHKKHLKELREDLLSSPEFRKNLRESLELYKTSLVAKAEIYNRRYKKPEDDLLKVQVDELLAALRKLYRDAGSAPNCDSEKLDPLSDVRKILQILAYLNLPEEHQEFGEEKESFSFYLQNLLEKLPSHLDAYFERTGVALEPKQAYEWWLLLKDLKREINKLPEISEIETLQKLGYLECLAIFEENLRKEAFLYYKTRPLLAMEKIEIVFQSHFIEAESFKILEREFEVLSLFVLNSMNVPILREFPVMYCLDQPVSPADCELSEREIVQGILNLMSKLNMEKFSFWEGFFKYLNFFEIMHSFSNVLSREDFINFAEIAKMHLKTCLAYMSIPNSSLDPLRRSSLMRVFSSHVKDLDQELKIWGQSFFLGHPLPLSSLAVGSFSTTLAVAHGEACAKPHESEDELLKPGK